MEEENNYIFLKVFFVIASLICLILYRNIFIVLISIAISLKFYKRINIYIIILYVLSIFISSLFFESKDLIVSYNILFITIKVLSIIVLIKDIIIPMYRNEKLKNIILNTIIILLFIMSLFNYKGIYKNKYLISSNEKNTYYGKEGYYLNYESDEGNITIKSSGFYFNIPFTKNIIVINGWIHNNKIELISKKRIRINGERYNIENYEYTIS
ncbi:MAG: hypothetical protein VZS44_02125 [Bacilli bacterium]|nr:hypothetical protein [Bacilli bacterium]